MFASLILIKFSCKCVYVTGRFQCLSGERYYGRICRSPNLPGQNIIQHNNAHFFRLELNEIILYRVSNPNKLFDKKQYYENEVEKRATITR